MFSTVFQKHIRTLAFNVSAFFQKSLLSRELPNMFFADFRSIATREGVPWVNEFHPMSALYKTFDSDY